MHLNLARYFMDQQGDDGFIFHRYALQLAGGHGPLWNPGETPVEGFSSPLWLGILGLAASLGYTPPEAARWLGLLAALAAMLGTIALARQLGASRWAAALAGLGLTCTEGLHYWAPGGLETCLYAALLTWGMRALLLPGRSWILWASLLGVCRPEGPAIAVAWAAVAWWSGKKSRVDVLIAMAPALAWEGFRLHWYEAWLPNTYFAKASGLQPEQFVSGLRYLDGEAWVIGGLAVLHRLRTKSSNSLMIAGLLGLLLFIVAWGGGDWMWHGRLVIPFLGGLWALWASTSLKANATSLLMGALFLSLLTPRWVSPETVVRAIQGERLPPEQHQEGTLLPASRIMAETIREISTPGQRVAINHAGVIPYSLPNLLFIDMAGLSDAWIAKIPAPLHQKFDADYILEQTPEWIVFNSRTQPGTDGQWLHTNYWAGETALASHPVFLESYRPYPRAWSRRSHGGGASYILLYHHKDVFPAQSKKP
jgi:arabinofuranosyltransferase